MTNKVNANYRVCVGMTHAGNELIEFIVLEKR